MKKHLDRFTLGDYEGIILNINKTIDKKSAQNPYKPVFNSYEFLLDFLYSF